MKNKNTYYLGLVTFVAAMGGLLFGYDWVVIGGAKPFYEVYFGITGSTVMQGWAMSSAILGCLAGVTVSGSMADRYGRRPLMLVASVVFIVSAVGTGCANTIDGFVFYRLIGGIAIGIASNVAPMYIAEISPQEVRGRFVSVNQLTIVLGILSAQLVNWLIAGPVAEGERLLESWNGQAGWRWMFWAENVPAALYLIFIFFIPESPRWLAVHARHSDARRILSRIGGDGYARTEMEKMQHAVAEHAGFAVLLRGRMPYVLLTGIVLACFQQWCGINVIFNYAQEIFAAAGYTVSDILFNIVVTGVTNVVFTFVGMYTVDRIGRRALLLFGAVGLACIYAALGVCYCAGIAGVAVLWLVVAAIACYAMTLAPVVWVVISEIFPTRVRGMAVAVSTFFLWAACFVLTYTFPLLNGALDAYGTFWLYGFICLLGFVYIYRNLPETKGKSLEDIEEELIGKQAS
ncbi:MAG: sugar porter family MFS transporter [Tannerella sp.]|jgi:SP family sugar porter-like MFS transporter|nr:sugar porter family MFS transporter [Tannerella sp.]